MCSRVSRLLETKDKSWAFKEKHEVELWDFTKKKPIVLLWCLSRCVMCMASEDLESTIADLHVQNSLLSRSGRCHDRNHLYGGLLPE